MWIIYLNLLFFAVVYAKTDLEYKLEITAHVMDCMKEHPVEMSELFNLEKLIVPTDEKTKCLLACAYRKEGLLTKEGLYDLKVAYKTAELLRDGDDKRVANGKHVADQCVKTNNIAVSDGEKGCERSALIFKCIVDTAPKYGFKV